MLTASMIAMFYLGTVSGVMGAVLIGTFRSVDSGRVTSLEGLTGEPDDLSHAAGHAAGHATGHATGRAA